MKDQSKSAGSEVLSWRLETLLPEQKRGQQKELAARLGRAQDLISRWANGWRVPTIADMVRLEEESGVWVPLRSWLEPVEEFENWKQVSLDLEAKAKTPPEAAVEPAETFPEAAATPSTGTDGR